MGSLVAAAVACSSPQSSPDGGADAGADAAVDQSASKDGSPGDAANSDAASDGSAGFTLTIHDYLDWCAVTVADGGPRTDDPQVFTFPPDTVVPLFADTANANLFVWGYWKGADPDGGIVTSKSTAVTMTGDKNVQACCPLVSAPDAGCP